MGLSIESSRPLVSGTFGTQYVSLMLIILTALVAIWVGAGGSFESSIHHAVSIQERETLVDAAVDTDDLQHIAPIGEIQFKRFFAPGGTQLNEDRSHALLEVLRTHDLIAHIDVANDVDQSIDPHSLSLKLARVAMLSRFLTQHEVPAHALDIAAIEQSVPWQVSVRFSWERQG